MRGACRESSAAIAFRGAPPVGGTEQATGVPAGPIWKVSNDRGSEPVRQPRPSGAQPALRPSQRRHAGPRPRLSCRRCGGRQGPWKVRCHVIQVAVTARLTWPAHPLTAGRSAVLSRATVVRLDPDTGRVLIRYHEDDTLYNAKPERLRLMRPVRLPRVSLACRNLQQRHRPAQGSSALSAPSERPTHPGCQAHARVPRLSDT